MICYLYITHDVLWIKKKDLYARPFYFSFIQMALNLHLRVCEYRTARTPTIEMPMFRLFGVLKYLVLSKEAPTKLSIQPVNNL